MLSRAVYGAPPTSVTALRNKPEEAIADLLQFRKIDEFVLLGELVLYFSHDCGRPTFSRDSQSDTLCIHPAFAR